MEETEVPVLQEQLWEDRPHLEAELFVASTNSAHCF